jgi:hypothetical protein
VGSLRDISLKGLYVLCENPFPESTKVRASLGLGAQAQAGIEVVGRIARAEPDGMAIEIEELGTASFQHLKRLVLLNSETPDESEREISGHVGLKARAGEEC